MLFAQTGESIWSSRATNTPKSWNFKLKKVYCIAILNFVLDPSGKDRSIDQSSHRHDIMLTNLQTGEIFYNNLRLIFLEMPKFTKSVDQLQCGYEKWMYVLANLHKLEQIPEILREEIFMKLFKTAEMAEMTYEEFVKYEHQMKRIRDNHNTMEYAIQEARNQGHEEGREEGRLEGQKESKMLLIKDMIKKGLATNLIADISGMSAAEIEKLRSQSE